VEITVLDDGTGDGAGGGSDPAEGGGHGLLGMRERVTALGGTLTTGPRYGGGFRVHAILPVTTSTRAPGDAA
jgi:signal transduction histidine kinase